MRTFLEETEEIINRLKNGEVEERFLTLGGLVKKVFLIDYRDTTFLFTEGTAWDTPYTSLQLGNLGDRVRFCLFCNILIVLSFECPSLIPSAIQAYSEGKFLDFLQQHQSSLSSSAEKLFRDYASIWQAPEKVVNLNVPLPLQEYKEYICSLLPAYKETIEKLYRQLNVTNPKYKPPEILSLWRREGKKFKLTNNDSFQIDRIIFLPEGWKEGKELPLVQLQVGITLFQKNKLTEQEKNELVKLMSQIKKPLDGLAIAKTLKSFRGSATPKGVLAYINKMARGKSVFFTGEQVELVEEFDCFQEEEQEREEEKRLPSPRLYKKNMTRESDPKNEYASIWEVAELLNREFPNIMKSINVWQAWLYREIKKGNIEVFKLERKVELPENVTYVSTSYFIQKEKIPEIIQLFRGQKERREKRKERATLIKLLASVRNVGIRQAQKLTKGKTEQEIREIIKKEMV